MVDRGLRCRGIEQRVFGYIKYLLTNPIPTTHYLLSPPLPFESHVNVQLVTNARNDIAIGTSISMKSTDTFNLSVHFTPASAAAPPASARVRAGGAFSDSSP